MRTIIETFKKISFRTTEDNGGERLFIKKANTAWTWVGDFRHKHHCNMMKKAIVDLETEKDI